MIATKMAVLMTATMLVAGFSVAPFFLGAEAGTIVTTRSNIKSSPIVQQEGNVDCTNQAQGQGAQQAVPNTEQNAITSEGDPIPDIDVLVPRAGEVSGEGDPTVDATQSNECSLTMGLTVEQNGDTEDSSTNEWTEQ